MNIIKSAIALIHVEDNRKCALLVLLSVHFEDVVYVHCRLRLHLYAHQYVNRRWYEYHITDCP